MAEVYVVRGFEGVSLAIMPRPRSGDWLEDEVASWRGSGIQTVVSLLEPSEVLELGLSDEPRLCTAHAIHFLSYPIPDRGTPESHGSLLQLVSPLVPKVRGGHLVAVHCRAGIGRSGVVAAAILIRSGIPYSEVFPALSRARGVTVPDTDAQSAWLQSFARFDG